MRLVSKLKTFGFLLRSNPRHAWDLLQLKAEARLGLSLHGVSLKRLLTRRFELRRTSKPSAAHVAYGNYLLDASRIGPRPVVFSIGVGEDIAFDQALLDRHDVRLFLFDPTPRSERYVAAAALPPNVVFKRLAVADYDGMIDLYLDDLEDGIESTTSVSIVDKGLSAGGAVSIGCRRVETLMKEHGVDRLDILKLDIEGAAIAVLEDVLDSGILPTQIAAEFERPDRMRDLRAYLRALESLFDRLAAAGYEIHRTRPNHKGFQVEILAVRTAAHGQPATERPPAAAVATGAVAGAAA